MPFGYLITTGLMAVFVLFAVAPPRPRRSSPMRLSFWLGFIVNELPFVAFYVLAASTALAIGQGDIANPVGWIGLGLAVLATAGLVVAVLRAMRTGAAVDDALIAAGLPARAPRRLPLRVFFWPFAVPHPGIERISNIAYGDAGRANLLDVYRSRSHSGTGPTLVHLHGGGVSRRQEEPRGAAALPSARSPRLGLHQRELPTARAVLRAARRPEERARLGSRARGRVRRRSECRLRGRQLGRWAPRFDGCSDRERSFGHRGRLACTATTAQSGQSVPRRWRTTAGTRRRSSLRTPIGTRWSSWKTRAGSSRRFDSGSANPVVYAELPGAQHGFDFFYSIRFEAVIDGIEAFADGVLRPTSSLRRPPTAPDPVTGSSGSPGRGRATRR